ncbi:sulfatase-like hydrolase/transferase [Pontiella sulfatireligans]|uniref:Arylsulfatase n=1 Tax=Pontiella sulfatireligans TaxID=2750658 RepID=A0A6C2UHN9_9BACT|nr:sulfatase-like hydrolase/transferase [Pontiella sulfatireligans]SPS74261.1 sulfatase S1_30 [Kiritimatiellales bacterium]VGO18921.1 Arylsulfatase [Pontiella sulfatireligans]
MKRRNFNQLITAGSAMALSGKTLAKKSNRPNLLFIVTDEHNFRTLGCYREQLSREQAEMWGPSNVVETPHIDSIAKRGTLFNRMYASAAVCTPARASMFTGMYGHQLGMPNNSSKPGDGKYLHADVPTIAKTLKNAGYMTGYSGKLHLAENTEKEEFWQPYPVDAPGYNYGFTDNKFMFNGGHDKYKGIDKSGAPYRSKLKNPQPAGTDAAGQPIFKDSKCSEVKFTTDWLADRAIEFIEENKDKPFYYVCSIPDPHTPDIVREPYISMYKDMKFEFPRTFDVARSKDLPSWQRPDGKAKPDELAAHLTHYFGMVKCIDDNVGRILSKLDDEGILENTIVVFCADHGDLMYEHARMNKGTIHETSAKVPFVIAHGKDLKNPRVPRGKVVREACNTTDWMPTFLSLLEVPCPPVAGRDVAPLLAKTPPADWNDVTFSKLGYIAAIDKRYKLVLSGKNQPWLMDIEADPDELTNYMENSEYADVARRMAKELKRFVETCEAGNQTDVAKLDAIING